MGRIIARFHAAGRGDTSFNSARAEVRRALSGRQRLSMFGESVEIIGNLFENSNFCMLVPDSTRTQSSHLIPPLQRQSQASMS